MSVLIFKPNENKTAAWLIEYDTTGNPHKSVVSMRQISIEDARAFWDVTVKSNDKMKYIGQIVGVYSEVIKFMEDIESRAGLKAVSLQSAIRAYSTKNTFDPHTKQYFANLPKVPGVQYKTAPNGGSVPTNICSPHLTNTNYALHA